MVIVAKPDKVVDARQGTQGADDINALEGNDHICGRSGNDTIYGGDGDDNILGGSGNDEIYGNNDNDTIKGGSGSDILFGNAGTDFIFGGRGDDIIYAIDETVGGLDEPNFDPQTEINEEHLLYGGRGDDVIYGSLGEETIIGGSGNDQIYGLGNNMDELKGGKDSDLLCGSFTPLFGGDVPPPSDTLKGQGGVDLCAGDGIQSSCEGSDPFAFVGILSTNVAEQYGFTNDAEVFCNSEFF